MEYHEFCDKVGFDVSRETFARLTLYAALLEKWQSSINLISKNTVSDMWQRHFLDSAQLYPLVKEKGGALVDIGSGAGFPGLVLAILGAKDVHLIESDIRKAVFLREVGRACDAPVKVHACRIEESPVQDAEIVTARALAALPQLLDYAVPLLKEGGHCIFLKGQTAEEEIAAAEENWNFSIQKQQTITNGDGVVLVLKDVAQR